MCERVIIYTYLGQIEDIWWSAGAIFNFIIMSIKEYIFVMIYRLVFFLILFVCVYIRVNNIIIKIVTNVNTER